MRTTPWANFWWRQVPKRKIGCRWMWASDGRWLGGRLCELVDNLEGREHNDHQGNGWVNSDDKRHWCLRNWAAWTIAQMSQCRAFSMARLIRNRATREKGMGFG